MENIDKFRYLVQCAYKEGNKTLGQYLKNELEITSSQSEVIRVLGDYQPLSLSEIGNLLLSESKSPSRLVKRLIEQGFIFQSPSVNDNRKIVLNLTEKGQHSIPKIVAIEHQLNQEIKEKLGNTISLEELNQILMAQIEGTQSQLKMERRSTN